MKKDQKKDRYFDRDSMRWMSAGVEFCGVIGIFCFGGYKLDEHFDTSPAWLLTGFFVSFAGMVYLFYKESKH